jgi:hypothetical protein
MSETGQPRTSEAMLVPAREVLGRNHRVASWTQDPVDLADNEIGVTKMLDHPVAADDVERRVVQGEGRVQIGSCDADCPLLGDPSAILDDLDAVNGRGTNPISQPNCQGAPVAAEVDQADFATRLLEQALDGANVLGGCRLVESVGPLAQPAAACARVRDGLIHARQRHVPVERESVQRARAEDHTTACQAGTPRPIPSIFTSSIWSRCFSTRSSMSRWEYSCRCVMSPRTGSTA